MNILLTSVGRRGYLVDFFKNAFFGKAKIFTSNSELTVAMKKSDGYLVSPLIYDDDYIEKIISFCVLNNIKIVMSLFDIDLLILSKNELLFSENGITLLLAPYNAIQKCNDKWATAQLLRELNIRTPRTYLSQTSVLEDVNNGDIDFPFIIKPRWGMASIGVYVVNNEDELLVLYKKCQNDILKTHLKYESAMTPDYSVIIQEYIDGYEYGIDAVNDLNENFVTCFAKQKIRMRAGETDLGKTVNTFSFHSIAEKLSNYIKHKGILSIDCIECNGNVYVIELNCRISGHYPVSHLAGFDFPRLLSKWLYNIPVTKSDLTIKENVVVSKEIALEVVNDMS